MKWFRNKEMLQNILNQNKNELEKHKHEKIVSLLKDEINLIQDHLTLLDENEKLKNAIECIKKCVKIIVKDCDFPIYDTPRYTLGIRAHYWEENPNGLLVYIKKEEYELLKEVFENEL